MIRTFIAPHTLDAPKGRPQTLDDSLSLLYKTLRKRYRPWRLPLGEHRTTNRSFGGVGFFKFNK